MINTDYFKKWNELEALAKTSNKDERITKFIGTDSFNNVFISSNNALDLSFSIEIDKDVIQDYKPKKVEGIEISVEDNQKINPKKKYLIVRNVEQENKETFIGFSVAVFNAVENTKNDMEALFAFEKELKRFNEYFKFKKSLSKKEEQGLLAELIYLENLINSKGDVSVSYWHGSEKNKRDFIIGNEGIEIKSSNNQEQDIISVSNENQLDPGNLDKLTLILYIFDENISGITISEKIKSIYGAIQAIEYKKMFLSKVSMHGIDPLKYEGKYSFYMEKIKTYIIDDSFPKITKDIIPDNAFDVKYKLNISNVNCIEKDN